MQEHNKEFCSLLNAAIRSDDARLMPSTAVLVRAINALCVAERKGQARAQFPPNGRTFRGTAFDDRHQFSKPSSSFKFLVSAVLRIKRPCLQAAGFKRGAVICT